MPGLTDCGRCHAVLVTAVPIAVHPPRARHAKGFHWIAYGPRRLVDLLDLSSRLERLREWMARSPSLGDLACMGLSLVPGLGHLLAGRLREIRWLWPAWLATLLAGLALLWVVQIGPALLCIAVALHTWMIVLAGRINTAADISARGRTLVVIVLFAGVMAGIYGLHQVTKPWLDFAWSGLTVPELGLYPKDFVLVGARAAAGAPLAPGDVALYDYPRIEPSRVFGNREGLHLPEGSGLGLVVATPGETLRREGGRLVITGRDGRTRETALPPFVQAATPEHWMHTLSGYFCLPAEMRQANAPRGGGYGDLMAAGLMRLALVDPAAVRGRAFAVASPPWRIHRLGRGRTPIAP